MICERCGHECVEQYPLDGSHANTKCIANLRADKAELRATWDSCLEELKATRVDLEAERARSWELAARPSISDCLAHRCSRHLAVPPRNAEEFGGAECGACIEERAACVEAQCAVMRAVLEEAETLDVEPRAHIADALATDAGRDLLTAVRRLCEVAEEVCAKLADGRFFVGSEGRDLREALADPALAGLQGTGPKVARDDSDRKRD